MKNTNTIWVVLIIAVAAIVMTATVMWFSNGPDMKTIDVTGTSSITKPADQAMLSIGVETQADTAEEAEAENTKISNELYDSLKELGLTEKDYKTQYFNVQPRKDWESGGNITGYSVQHNIEIDTDNIEKVPEILDAAVQAGANNIYGVHFTLKEETREMARAEAYQKATTYARTKAESIAEGLGVEITKIVRVSDASYNYMPYRADIAIAEVSGASAKGESIPIESGEVEVTSTISVSYAFR